MTALVLAALTAPALALEPEFADDVVLINLDRADAVVQGRFVDPILAGLGAGVGVSHVRPLYRPTAHRKNPEAFRALGMDRAFVVQLDGSAPARAAVARFAAAEGVEHAELVGLTRVARAPSDPWFVYQWSLRNQGTFNDEAVEGADIDAASAWELTTGEGIVVAVLDTGLNRLEPDIAERAWVNPGETPDNGIDDDENGYVDDVYGWNFPNDNGDIKDLDAHGTNVSGIIGATGNNGMGVTGVCWACTILPVKNISAYGSGNSAWFAESVVYAVDNGAQVINMSEGGYGYNLNEHLSVKYAHESGIPILAAMGNDDTDDELYPAAFQETIAVGATDQADRRISPDNDYWGSNYGGWIDVVAPGDSIRSLSRINGDYEQAMSGTSQATPHAAGVVALLLSVDPSLDVETVRSLLRDSAADRVGEPSEDRAGWDEFMGAGRIDAYAALRLLDPTLGDEDGDGWAVPYDCDDEDTAVNPDAEEACDEIDTDCDGSLADEFPDTDDDGIPDCIDTPDDTDDGETPGGCGCQVAPAPGAGVVLLALLWLRRRR